MQIRGHFALDCGSTKIKYKKGSVENKMGYSRKKKPYHQNANVVRLPVTKFKSKKFENNNTEISKSKNIGEKKGCPAKDAIKSMRHVTTHQRRVNSDFDIIIDSGASDHSSEPRYSYRK